MDATKIEKLASVISDAGRKNAIRFRDTVRGLLNQKLRNVMNREMDRTKKEFFTKK